MAEQREQRPDSHLAPLIDAANLGAADLDNVIPFRPRARNGNEDRGRPPPRRMLMPGRPPIDDLARYQRPGRHFVDGTDDYRHRMIVNALALIVCLGLAGAGCWLADQIAQMRRTQECVLSGRVDCAHIPQHH